MFYASIWCDARFIVARLQIIQFIKRVAYVCSKYLVVASIGCRIKLLTIWIYVTKSFPNKHILWVSLRYNPQKIFPRIIVLSPLQRQCQKECSSLSKYVLRISNHRIAKLLWKICLALKLISFSWRRVTLDSCWCSPLCTNIESHSQMVAICN